MKKIIILLAILIQTNAWAMGDKHKEPSTPAPPPAPVLIPAPKFSEEEVQNFAKTHDYYTLTDNWLNCSYESISYAECSTNYAEFISTRITTRHPTGEKISKLQSPLLTGYKLKSASKNGKNYIFEIELKSQILPYILTNRDSSFFIQYEGTLTRCDDTNMTGYSGDAKIEDLFASLQGINFKDFYSCTIELQKTIQSSAFIDSEDFPFGVVSNNDFTFNDYYNKKLKLNVYKNGKADFFFYNVVDSYEHTKRRLANPGTREINSQARDKAIASAKKFISLIKSHGVEIAKSAMPKNLTDRERQTILLQSLLQKKPMIIEALRGVNDNFENLEIMDKLSVSKAIRDAYTQVQAMEELAEITPDNSILMEMNPYILGE